MSAKEARRVGFVNTVAELGNVDIIISICHFYGWLMLCGGVVVVFVKPCGK